MTTSRITTHQSTSPSYIPKDVEASRKELIVVDVKEEYYASLSEIHENRGCFRSVFDYLFHHVVLEQLHLPNNDTLYYGLIILTSVLSWLTLFLMVSEELFPYGDGFSLLVMVIVAFAVGHIFTLLKLPDLLGNLLTGVAFRTGGLVVIRGLYANFVSCSRDIAMAIILLKAGLGLDLKALREKALIVFNLVVFPFIAESSAAAVIAHYMIGFSWVWGLLLGFLLSSISPAVVIPPLVKLKKLGYGQDSGFYSLIVASASLDDIFSVGAFGICQTIIFNQGPLLLQVFQPVSIIIGFSYGFFWGVFCSVLPHKNFRNVTAMRSIYLTLGGLIAVLGSMHVRFPGCGPLACVVAASVANLCWKKQSQNNQDDEDEDETPVERVFTGMWFVMQPLLFSFIGAEIDLTALDPYQVGYAVTIIFGSLIFRVAACSVALIGTNFTQKERLFLCIAWMPKATVQAILGPQPLATLRAEKNTKRDPVEFDWAITVFNTAVLSIILTTPVCSVILSTIGTKLVRKDRHKSGIDR